MTLLIQQNFDSNFGGTLITPGFASRNSAPLYDVTRQGLPKMSVERIGPPSEGGAGSEEFENWMKFEDWANGWNRVVFDLDDIDTGGIVNSPGGSLPLQRYSVRVYFKMDSFQNAVTHQGAPTVFQIQSDDTTHSWAYHLSGYSFVNFLGRNHKPGIYNGQPTGAAPGPLVTTGNAPAFGSQDEQDTYSCGIQTWRLEVQVDSSKTQKVVARIYTPDGTSANAKLSLQGSPTNVGFKRLIIGDNEAFKMQQIMYLSHLEVHDDYDLGGQFTSNPAGTTPASLSATGAPYRRPVYEVFRLDRENEVLEPIEIAGTLNRTSGTIVTADASMKINDMDYRCEVPGSFIKHTWFLGEPIESGNPVQWIPGNQGTNSGLIYPDPEDHPMPAGGYPIVLWAHSGFFTGGSYRDMPKTWMFSWLNRGFALMSLGYFKSAIDLISPYDTNAGKYPTWIWDYKFAARWAKSKGMQGDETYPINTNKMIFTGYSAGGYLALGAMASRELGNDGSGRDLRIRNAAYLGFGGTVTDLDPEPLACIVYGAPTDMKIAVQNDPTASDAWGYIMRTTAKGFIGNAQDVAYVESQLDNTSIMNMVERNAARLKPTLYIRGGSDYLVIKDHEEALAEAFATYAPDVDYQMKVADGVVHDRLADQFNFNHVDRFLATVPGL